MHLDKKLNFHQVRSDHSLDDFGILKNLILMGKLTPNFSEEWNHRPKYGENKKTSHISTTGSKLTYDQIFFKTY